MNVKEIQKIIEERSKKINEYNQMIAEAKAIEADLKDKTAVHFETLESYQKAQADLKQAREKISFISTKLEMLYRPEETEQFEVFACLQAEQRKIISDIMPDITKAENTLDKITKQAESREKQIQVMYEQYRNVTRFNNYQSLNTLRLMDQKYQKTARYVDDFNKGIVSRA